MTQVIGVTYLFLPVDIPTPAGNVEVLDAWHLALFYDDGAGNIKVIEARPQNKFPDQVSAGQALAEAAKEQWSMTNENDGSPFGLIVGDPGAVRAWTADDAKLPSETLLPGPDLSSIWNGITQDAIQKLAAGYEYRVMQQNSNTFVGTLLSDARSAGVNILMPTGQPVGMAFIPGLQNTLHDPIGQRSDLPSSLGATDFAFANPDPNTTSIVIGDPTYETVQWEDGQVSVTLNGQSSAFESYGVTSVTASGGHVELIGSSGGSTFDGNGSDCLMLGGPGDDTFLLGYGGNDWIDGGSGNNQVIYSKSTDSYTVTLSASNSVDGGSNDQVIQVQDNATGGLDKITSVESIQLGTSDNNTVVVKSLAGFPTPKDATTIDLGATSASSNDTLDFTQYGGNIYLGSASSADGGGQAIGLFGGPNNTAFTGLSFTGAGNLKLGGGNDTIDIGAASDPFLSKIDTGDGNDTASVARMSVAISGPFTAPAHR